MADNQLAEPRSKRKDLMTLLQSDQVKQGFAAVATNFLTPDKMLRLCINAVRRTPDLLKCDPQTVLGSMMTAMALGLEPNTVLGHAYLIPYRRRTRQNGQWVEIYECQFQIGYKGLIALMRRNPYVINVFCETVHDNDFFDYRQGNETLVDFRKALTNRGDPIASFAYLKYRRGEFEADAVYIMPIDEVEKIREQSDTFRSLRATATKQDAKDWEKKKLQDTPWVKWFDEMAAKSALKRLAKMQDLEPTAQIGAHLDDAADIGRARLADMSDPNFARDVIDGVATPVADDEDEEGAEIQPPQQRQQQEAKKAAPAKKAPPPKQQEAKPEPEPQAQQGDPRPEPEPQQQAQPEPAEPEQTPHDPETGEVYDENESTTDQPGSLMDDPDDDDLFKEE